MEKKMSKAVNSVFGGGNTKTLSYETQYQNYLKNYDTYNYDQSVKNLDNTALNMSQNLSSLPDYQFTVDGSDEARQRMENATYQSYVDKLTPQFEQQKTDLETSLLNKGLSVGSEAYQRAMNDLTETQNESLNQAAYKSVASGQEAFNNSFKNNLYAAQFSNNSRQSYIDQILSLLSNSVSGYENQANLYEVNKEGTARKTQASNNAWNRFTQVASGISPYASYSYKSLLSD